MIRELQTLPAKIQRLLDDKERIQWFASKFANARDIFFIGRGIDYAISLEGSLKMKEISYIHSEAYAAGELKHGTISLIEEGTPVIAISTETALYEKTESNVREVGSRGAYVILLCREDTLGRTQAADEVVALPCTSDAACLFGALTAVQLLAYETSVLRGCDVDRPRNLAKSVTVE
jgi:glucosamine--fructose-6-phosphate aminotransferase (isomerizing)